MPPILHRIAQVLGLFVMLLVTGCASTTFTVTPSPQSQVCQSGPEKLNAVVLWGGSWRANQKDVRDRESAAARGIDRFFGEASCFSKVTIRKEQPTSALSQTAASLVADHKFDRSVVLLVRELGPVLKFGSSLALVEGGTEVVVDVSVYSPGRTEDPQRFTAHWSNSGAGVVKGVASLPDDMVATLRAALRPDPK